jgi:hypothetical protein
MLGAGRSAGVSRLSRSNSFFSFDFGDDLVGVLVQENGWQRSFQPSMKAPLAVVRSLTLVKLPRRIAWRVMIR